MNERKLIVSMHPHRTPEPISQFGLGLLEAGDMVVDLRKREKVLSGELPEAAWLYYLISQDRAKTRLHTMKGYKTIWHAVRGPGDPRLSGRATSLTPARLLRMHRIGNVRNQPFIVDYPTEVP
ncbi:hypothetical protein PBI_DEWDROP_90 [Microbacterium phage Dewdrop]|nr:hypothetical protein PBI_LEAF_90 [Microbacterium phage Leaf]QGZ17458.1 hypothetical protein PBI_DEWDROP_90 [Microbacterium phage Dewdrop]